MRELGRESPSDTPACRRLAIVGPGRLGTALAGALRSAGIDVTGPLGRGADGVGADAVLLCVPDAAIAAAASSIAPGPLVGHCSGATTLDVVAPHEAFSLHPLMTVTAAGASFDGAGAAIAGTSPRALALAGRLAATLGMHAVEIDEADRAAYHASASIASNFLVTVEAAAERLAAGVGVDRALLVPLIRAAVENWASLGSEHALTGPVARGDEVTVEAQREAIARRAPELLALFDALADATRTLAMRERARQDRSEPVLAPPPRAQPATDRPRPGAAGGIKTVRTVDELRAGLAAARRSGWSIGLVPTMGAFHEGHLSLMRRARAECDVVVVSLFVNPTQFHESSDLQAYPRDEERDAAQANELGVDFLFAPSAQEVYLPGFATTVSIGGVTDSLEGVHRGRGHFDGVTTVVTKLFNMVSPDVAYFGQKDAQQAIVIKQLVRDLNMPVRIEVCETVREPNGLAMSSRNVHLSEHERERATALRRALLAAEQAVAAGARDPRLVTEHARTALAEAEIEPDYLALVSAETLAPVQRVDGDVLALVAARVGPTRLIDNHMLSTAPRADRALGIQPRVNARGSSHPAAAGSKQNGRH